QNVGVPGGFGMYYAPVPEAAFDPARENPPFHALEDNCCGTAGPPFDGFGSPFDGGLILYTLGTSNSPLSFPGNPLLGGGIGPNYFPKNGGAGQSHFLPQEFFLSPLFCFFMVKHVQLPHRSVG